MKLALALLILCCSISISQQYSIQQQRFREYYHNRGGSINAPPKNQRPKVSQSWNNNNNGPWNNNNQQMNYNRPQQQQQQYRPNTNFGYQQPRVTVSNKRQFNFPQVKQQKCGIYKPQIRNKVANGQSTQHFEWPWYVQVIVKTDVEAYCGGTLISNEYILTAAHCFDDIPQEHLARATTVMLRGIRLFNYVLNDYEKIEAKADVVLLNPDYVPTMSYDEAEQLGIEPGPRNDIALIKIKIDHSEIQDQLMPACLPSNRYQLPIGSKCKIMGHGFTNSQSEDSFTMPNMLQMADVLISANDMCRAEVDSDAIRTKITEDTLCIRGPVHPCVGDSGGPLVCKGMEPNEIRGDTFDEYDYDGYGDGNDGRDEEWYLTGVTSFAVSTDMNDKCGLFKSAIFGKVSNHREWIRRVTGV